MVGIASRCPFEGIVMVAYATFFLYLRFAGSLHSASYENPLQMKLFRASALRFRHKSPKSKGFYALEMTCTRRMIIHLFVISTGENLFFFSALRLSSLMTYPHFCKKWMEGQISLCFKSLICQIAIERSVTKSKDLLGFLLILL